MYTQQQNAFGWTLVFCMRYFACLLTRNRIYRAQLLLDHEGSLGLD